MKKKTKIKMLILIIFFILLILFLILYKIQKKDFAEDFIFFKLFSQSKQNQINTNDNENQIYKYYFDFSNKNEISTNISLLETIDQKKLINEKIAPGTEGEFELILQANKDINYQIEFISQNIKPQNLTFSIKGKNQKYQRIEELAEELQGNVNKNERKKIIIQWIWNYETDIGQDIQDTKDGTTLKDYRFHINAIGREI